MQHLSYHTLSSKLTSQKKIQTENHVQLELFLVWPKNKQTFKRTFKSKIGEKKDLDGIKLNDSIIFAFSLNTCSYKKRD